MKALWYDNISIYDLAESVHDALIDLSHDGLVRIDDNASISLTKAGLLEYNIIKTRERVKLDRQKKKIKAKKKDKFKTTEEKKAASKEVHEKLKTRVSQLADFLGKTWNKEYELASPVVLDLIWYADKESISHAFEVQHRGDWKNAIGNLEAALRYYPDCKAFLIVGNEKEITRINELLTAKLEDHVKIVRISELERWVNVLEKHNRYLIKRGLENVTELAELEDRATVLRIIKREYPERYRLLDTLNDIVRSGLFP